MQAKILKTDLHPFEFIASHSGVSKEHIHLEKHVHLIKQPPTMDVGNLTFIFEGKTYRSSELILHTQTPRNSCVLLFYQEC